MMGNDDNPNIGRAMMMVGDGVSEHDIDGLEHVLSDYMLFKNMVEMANNNPRPHGVTVYDYILGVAFVSYIMNGYDVINSYAFATNTDMLTVDDDSVRELERKANNLNSRKFVTDMKKGVIAPIYIRYQYIVDEAMNTAVELMRSANSEKVRLDATALLLDKLTIPEETRLKIEQNVTSTMMLNKDDMSAINRLNDVLDNISTSIKSSGVKKPMEISRFDLLSDGGS